MFEDGGLDAQEDVERDGGVVSNGLGIGFVFESMDTVVVGVLIGEELDGRLALLWRQEIEDAAGLIQFGMGGGLGSQAGGDERFANADGAIEEYEFAEGHESWHEPVDRRDGGGGLHGS